MKKNEVHFYGKLAIESLDWLSDQGRRWLELDLRQRDREIHFEHALTGLTLGELYAPIAGFSPTTITVWIQCDKSMQARFLCKFLSSRLAAHLNTGARASGSIPK